MADRYGMAHVRTAFRVWLEAIGGISTEEARERGLPITNTFRIENLTILGEGRTRLRIAHVTSENGSEYGAIGDQHSNPKQIVALLNAGIMTAELRKRLTPTLLEA